MADQKITVEYGRRKPLGQYESVSASAMLTFDPALDAGQVSELAAAATIGIDLLRVQVEAVIDARVEEWELGIEIDALRRALLSRHVPPDEAALALDAMGLAWPETADDARAAILAVKGLTPDTLPIDWVWFREGRRASPAKIEMQRAIERSRAAQAEAAIRESFAVVPPPAGTNLAYE